VRILCTLCRTLCTTLCRKIVVHRSSLEPVQTSTESSQQHPKSRGPGRPFRKGECPNPGGRPKVVAEVRALAQEQGPKAIARLTELMGSEDGRVAVAACQALLDRAYGRPSQELAITALAAAAFVGDPTVVSDPVEASRAYAALMRGEAPLESVRFLPAPRGPVGQASRESAGATIEGQVEAFAPVIEAEPAPAAEAASTREAQ
jgi:hypothetical protein